MSGSLFTPKIKQVVEDVAERMPLPETDNTGSTLVKVSQYAIIALVGLVPIFFMPGLWASLGFDKTILTIVFEVVIVISLGLLTLRRHEAKTVLPISLILFWLTVLFALASGFLSGDVQDSLRGTVMETQTVSFLAVLALAMSTPLVLQGSKNMTIKALSMFGFVALILLAYNFLRLIIGPDFLAFSSFGSATVSPIGGFNDLAIFAGLSIIFGLVTMVQLPLRKLLQYVISFLVLLSLVILMVVNFFNIWLIVGFFGLLLFVYLLSRDTLFKSSSATNTSGVLVVTTMLVCIVSAVFIVAGDYAGAKMGELTNVDYVEVRPSVGATVDIASAVYKENVLFGVGPNRFSDAWRQYKDRSINDTIFWDTDFSAGSGYIPTMFINLGLLGGLMMVLFHVYFIYLGYKMLLRGTTYDSYWYYFGVVSFASAVFLWVMSYIYVPGAGILLLTALFTGLSFVAFGSLVPSAVRTIPLAINRQRGFVLMATTILVISGSIAVLLSVSKQYVAEARFSEAQVTSESVAAFEQVAMTSYGMYPDARFVSARAQIHLATLNSLIAIAEPTEDDKQLFLSTAEQAVVFAEQAVAEDITNPDHQAVLAGVFSDLALAGVDGAQARSESALKRAQELDPINPGYRLLAAQMAVRIGDLTLAREEIAASLNMKRNFTEALFLSAQIDINEGKVDSAISTTRAIITLEPNNPTRYFQLGVLLASNNNLPESIAAYRAAISLDPNYANARYMLALTLISTNQTAEAIEHLKLVQQFNQENTDLGTLIQKLEAGEEVSIPNLGLNTPVSDSVPNAGFDEVVTTTEDIESGLVTPVNTISTAGEKPVVNKTPVQEATSTVPTE